MGHKENKEENKRVAAFNTQLHKYIRVFYRETQDQVLKLKPTSITNTLLMSE